MTKPTLIDTKVYPNTLIVGIHSPYNYTKNISSYYEEFANLIKSNGIIYTDSLFIKLRTIDPGYFLSTGKLEELADLCRKLEIEEVIISEPLSAQQERNLSRFLKCKVFDRTQLILEIFEKGANSAEGKIQVELAMLQHKKSRLTGHGLHMSQQAGKIGTRGPGETFKEKETQHLERLMSKLRKDLEQLAKTRQTQRKKRLTDNVAHVCLIGYTNAGKSTILNALTHSDVLAEDKLFATLDTTTRELYINKTKIGLISDTVGFIQQLPHNLIEAFKSTLTELQYAHLLLQVVDISDKNFESHILVVNEILEELDVKKPMLYLFNKSDKIELTQDLLETVEKYQPYVIVNSVNPGGLEPLKEFLVNWKQQI